MTNANVTERLEQIGYTAVDDDADFIAYIIGATEQKIKDFCNTSEIPDGLNFVAVDMAAGEFVFAKKSNGTLTGFDFEAAVKSITEGDTSVTFAYGSGSKTPEARFDALINGMINGHKAELVKYRGLSW